MLRAKDIQVGTKVGKLTVIQMGLTRMESKRKVKACLCKCECGNEKVISLSCLTGKNPTKSCGCNSRLAAQRMGYRNHKETKFNLSGEYGIGYCVNTGREFYFDLADYDLIKDYCISEHRPTKGYARPIYHDRVKEVNVPAKSAPLWHLLGLKGYDHINHDAFDNRRENLRPCTQHQNSFNAKLGKNNTSGITGVNWFELCGKWRARIMVNRREIHLGLFNDINNAIKARLEAEKKYFGEFAPQRHLYSTYGITED